MLLQDMIEYLSFIDHQCEVQVERAKEALTLDDSEFKTLLLTTYNTRITNYASHEHRMQGILETMLLVGEEEEEEICCGDDCMCHTEEVPSQES